jgi:hypothetical protein
MNFLKKLHLVFQFIIIGVLLILFFYTCIHFRVGPLPAFILFIVLLPLGASITTHVENQLQYNLEDTEMDLLRNIEARVVGDEKKVVQKVRSILGKKV